MTVTGVIVSDCYWCNSSVTGVIVTVTGVIVSDCYWCNSSATGVIVTVTGVIVTVIGVIVLLLV